MSVLTFADWQTHFAELVTRGQLAHAYLLTGEDQEQQQDLAIYIAQLLATKGRLDDEELTERIADDQFPDVWTIVPDGRYVRVDQIRQLRTWATSSPVEADFKCVIIQSAHLMNPSAANALLTLLEEPVANVYLLLQSPAANLLLPTIVSRTQEVYLPAVGTSTHQTYLQEEYDLPAPTAQLLAYFDPQAQAHWLEEFDLQLFNQWLKLLQAFYRQLLALDPLSFVSVQQHLSQAIKGPKASAALDYLTLLNHQILMSTRQLPSLTMAEPILSDTQQQQLLQDLTCDLVTLLRIQEALVTAKRYLNANVPSQLVFEQLALTATEKTE